MIEIIFRTISATALIVLIVQFAMVIRQSVQRLRLGANGITPAVLYWAAASVLYSTNEIIRLYLMSLPTFPNRGLIMVIGSAVTRVLLVAALVHLLHLLRKPAQPQQDARR